MRQPERCERKVDPHQAAVRAHFSSLPECAASTASHTRATSHIPGSNEARPGIKYLILKTLVFLLHGSWCKTCKNDQTVNIIESRIKRLVHLLFPFFFFIVIAGCAKRKHLVNALLNTDGGTNLPRRITSRCFDSVVVSAHER